MIRKLKIHIFTLLILFVDLGAMFVGLVLVYNSTVGKEIQNINEELEIPKLSREREDRESNPIIYTMDKITVNLDGYPRRIIQTEISLEMLDDKGFEEVVNLGPEARDAIVRILHSKTFDDVETLQGKLFLKDQIASKLNHFMKDGIVKEVYFNEFIVQ